MDARLPPVNLTSVTQHNAVCQLSILIMLAFRTEQQMLQPFSSTMLNQDELETIESLLSASRSKVAKATLHKIQNPESFELARAFQQYNDSYCVIPYNDKKAKLPSTQFIAGVMYNWGKRNAGQSMKTCIAAVPFFVEMWKKQHAEWLSYYK